MPMPERQAGEGRAAPTVKQAPDEARGRTPTRGAQASAGQRHRRDRRRAARASGCRPAAAPGSGSSLDVARLLLSRLHRDDGRAHPSELEPAARASRRRRVVKFTIQRDGTLTDVDRRASRAATTSLDLAAQRAVLVDATAAAAAGGVSRTRR